MKISILASGSSGNSIYIESGEKSILLDAGLSEKKLSARMAHIGRNPADLNAVFLTHEHSDHVGGVGPLVRKYGIPLYSTEGTMKRIRNRIGRIPQWNPIRAGVPVPVGDLRVDPYATPHDAEESVAFVIRHGEIKLGHATDLGSVTPEVKARLKDSDALLLESNHDVDMLNAGPYPWSLKQRIRGDLGHLSNESCGELLASLSHRKLRLVVLMHLSQKNNHPEIASLTAKQALGDHPARLLFASQDEPTELFSVEAFP